MKCQSIRQNIDFEIYVQKLPQILNNNRIFLERHLKEIISTRARGGGGYGCLICCPGCSTLAYSDFLRFTGFTVYLVVINITRLGIVWYVFEISIEIHR